MEDIKNGDYVITEDFRLLKVKSVEERKNGNLRYNFTTGKFGLKDETNLGSPKSTYKKVDISGCINEIKQEKHSYAARLLEWAAKEGFVLINTTDKILWCRKAESVSYNSYEIIQAFNEHEKSKIEKK